MFINILIVLGGAIAGALITAIALKGRKIFDFEKKKAQAEEILKKSTDEAKSVKEEAVKRTAEIKKNIEVETEEGLQRVNKLKQSLGSREALIQKKEARNREKYFNWLTFYTFFFFLLYDKKILYYNCNRLCECRATYRTCLSENYSRCFSEVA